MRIKDKGYTVTEVAGVEKIEVQWFGDNETGYTEIVVHHTNGKTGQSFDEDGLADYIHGLLHAQDVAAMVTRTNQSGTIGQR